MAEHTSLRLFLTLFVLALLLCTTAAAQETPPLLKNAGFEKDLTGWNTEANVSLETAAPLVGAGSLRLGPGKAAARQRYDVGGLRVVGFWAHLKADPPGAGGNVRVRCYDAHDHMLLDTSQGLDPKKPSPTGDEPGVYFKTQAHTAYMIVSIEKNTDGPGYVYADSARVQDDDRNRVAHAPVCDLRQYMQPIWRGNIVYNETVLLESDGGKPASGRLMFTPKHILSAQDYGLDKTYIEGKEYTLDGRTITCKTDTTMPFVKDTDFPAGDLKWYELIGKHIVVTYTHDDAWSGPVPAYVGDHLPRTVDKLRRRLPLTVVADGDSITAGNNVSAFMEVPPYMPTWAELFADSLKRAYGDDKITLYNTALGGTTTYWGVEYADSTVAALDPDLVILAFGMNDFWSLSPEEFKTNIKAMIDRIRVRRPESEFLLVASMRFDPAYAADPIYTAHMLGYVTALRSLTGDGVQMLDMNAFSAALFAAKKPKDVIANPLHPNDFLARCYAQGLAAMLEPPKVEQ